MNKRARTLPMYLTAIMTVYLGILLSACNLGKEDVTIRPSKTRAEFGGLYPGMSKTAFREALVRDGCGSLLKLDTTWIVRKCTRGELGKTKTIIANTRPGPNGTVQFDVIFNGGNHQPIVRKYLKESYTNGGLVALKEKSGCVALGETGKFRGCSQAGGECKRYRMIWDNKILRIYDHKYAGPKKSKKYDC